jgi:hypothetical protein
MLYPTIQEVQEADHFLLGTWLRKLPSPGMNAVNAGMVNNEDYGAIRAAESAILNLISNRFNELGGWNPQLSKAIGFMA